MRKKRVCLNVSIHLSRAVFPHSLTFSSFRFLLTAAAAEYTKTATLISSTVSELLLLLLLFCVCGVEKMNEKFQVGEENEKFHFLPENKKFSTAVFPLGKLKWWRFSSRENYCTAHRRALIPFIHMKIFLYTKRRQW